MAYTVGFSADMVMGGQVVERMAASASGQGTARLYAYSGHDTTIMPILATLGVKLDDWPEYVSNVVSCDTQDAADRISLIC
jgi:hypothetical protein